MDSTMSEYKQIIRQFFSRFFRTDELGDADDVFAGGYVNSLFAIQLIAWLEKEFSITIEDDDLQLVNFSTINSIAQMLGRKQGVVVAA
ncbi:MAG TPA: acyl carrier protein [Acidobacteriaceae bacterium]|nr:acyl carrier protein [Acidobacteriaceae bacterium]